MSCRLATLTAALLACALARTAAANDDTHLALPADPRVTHVGLVAPDTLGVTVEAQHRVPGRQQPYVPQPGDEIGDGSDRWLTRDGVAAGSIVGRDGEILMPFDAIIGSPLHTVWADRASSYRLTRGHSDEALMPVAAFRKSKPIDEARLGTWDHAYPQRHTLYLRFAAPLAEGASYTLNFEGHEPPIEAVSFTVDYAALRSEAVRVSHLGFRPDDPDKVAYLSLWMGDGGPAAYDQGMPFYVLDDNGRRVFEGQTQLSLAKDQAEAGRGRNYSQVDVYRMDFSPVSEPGVYRVVVPGVGSSYTFPIGHGVWRDAFVVSMQGLLHHRSGIALGEPFTTYVRPRTMVPGEDGFGVRQADTPLKAPQGQPGGQDGAFERLRATGTDVPVPEAWGGYMDAGDWDRRAPHLYATRLLLELYEMRPGFFADLPLRVPPDEAGNHLPDLLDEALFNLDFYRRLQQPDGGIRGGVESTAHPRYGETSWQESLPVYAFAAGPYSSYEYAATAARAARLLAGLDDGLASLYAGTAARAFDWAETAAGDASRWDMADHTINDARSLAAVELYKLTGEAGYHDVARRTLAFREPEAVAFAWQKHHQREHAYAYVTAARPVDEAIAATARAALLAEADQRAAMTGQTGFGWANDPYAWVGWGQQTTLINDLSLVRAHHLTGEPRYLKAIIRATGFGAGANPSNIVYTTGLGHDWPRHVLHIDSHVTLQPVPAGINVYGPHDERSHGPDKPLYWATKKMAQKGAIYPDVRTWPPLESHWDIMMHPACNEYTVMQNLGPNAYVWGYLAARP